MLIVIGSSEEENASRRSWPHSWDVNATVYSTWQKHEAGSDWKACVLIRLMNNQNDFYHAVHV